MKGYKFYAVMPQDRGSKSASKKYPHDPFTRKRLTERAEKGDYVECVAVDVTDHNGRSWRYNPGGAACVLSFEEYGRGHIGYSSFGLEWLAKRCVSISEELARKLHPELFSYLESE